MLTTKIFRLTYSFDREEIFTSLVEYSNLENAMAFARELINEEHKDRGENAFNDVVGISFLEQVEENVESN